MTGTGKAFPAVAGCRPKERARRVQTWRAPLPAFALLDPFRGQGISYAALSSSHSKRSSSAYHPFMRLSPNFARHGVSFDEAKTVFDDPLATTQTTRSTKSGS